MSEYTRAVAAETAPATQLLLDDASVLSEAIGGLFSHCDDARLGGELADTVRFFRTLADRAALLQRDAGLGDLTREELLERYPVLTRRADQSARGGLQSPLTCYGSPPGG